MSASRCWPGLALGTLLSSLAAPAGASCGVTQLDVAVGVQASRWQEDSTAGERLLQERGSLGAWSLAVQGPCAGLRWVAHLEGLSGRRDYQGRSSTGVPLSTHSQVQSQRLSLQVWHELEGGAWALGSRLGWEPRAVRALASVGPVQGYEEGRERWRLGLGARWLHGLPGGWSGTWQGWLDGGAPARLTLRGEPFGSQVVRIGEGRWLGATLGFTAGPAPQAGVWQPWLGWQWEGLRSRVGAPEAVRLDSGRLLAVSQPAYRQSDGRLLVGLRLNLE